MKRKMSENISLKTKLKYLCFGSFLLFAPVVTQTINAQTTGIVMKAVRLEHEDLVRPMNSMMNRIYNIKMTGDFDKDYLSIMKEFHQGGIDLCKVYQMSGEDPKLLENAKVNALELKEDQKLLSICTHKDSKTASGQSEPNDLMPTLNNMIKRMEQKGRSGDLNNDYVYIMAAYDWANIEMAKAELRNGQNTELKNRSSEIIEESSCRENTLTEWMDKSVAEK